MQIRHTPDMPGWYTGVYRIQTWRHTREETKLPPETARRLCPSAGEAADSAAGSRRRLCLRAVLWTAPRLDSRQYAGTGRAGSGAAAQDNHHPCRRGLYPDAAGTGGGPYRQPDSGQQLDRVPLPGASGGIAGLHSGPADGELLCQRQHRAAAAGGFAGAEQPDGRL